MASEAEASSIAELPLLIIPPKQSPEPSGTLTPPLNITAKVPFRWEEEPGKPRHCTTLVTFSNPADNLALKCLEPPPRMFIMDTKIGKLSSPTTVLEGPYLGSGKLRFQSSSFRMASECYGSFGGNFSPERGQLSTIVIGKKRLKEKKLFGSWQRRALKGKREESLSGVSHAKSHFWATIYEGLKQVVVPWRSRKVKKNGL